MTYTLEIKGERVLMTVVDNIGDARTVSSVMSDVVVEYKSTTHVKISFIRYPYYNYQGTWGDLTVVGATTIAEKQAIVSSSLASGGGGGTSSNVNVTNTSVTVTNADITTMKDRTPLLGQTTMATSSPVVIASDQSNIPSNQTLITAGFSKVTNGVNTAAVTSSGSAAISADPALVVAIHPSSKGTEIQNAAGQPVVVQGPNATPAANDRSLTVSLSPNSAVVNGNVTIGTAAFSRITDGTNNAVVKAASTRPALTDGAAVVTLSGNSANMGLISAAIAPPSMALSGGVFNTVSPLVANGQSAAVQLNSDGKLLVASSNVGASNKGVYTRYRNIALTNTVQTVKATVGNLYGINLINENTSQPVYVKFFDAATVTLGTTAPILTIPVPPNNVIVYEPSETPFEFFQVNSIKVVAVAGLNDANVTAPITPIYIELKYI